MNNTIKTIILTLLVFGLYACSGKQAQTKKYFRIASSQVSSTTDIKPLTLVVKRPTALSILGGRPMVATKDDQSLIQLSHNFWIESPKVLLHDIIKNWSAQHWQSVTTQTPNQINFQTLNTRILAFEKNQALATVTLEFFLYDDLNTLLFNKTFTHSETIEDEGFNGFSRAIGRSVDHILSQLANEL